KIKTGTLTSLPVKSEIAVRVEATSRRFIRDPNVIAWVTVNAGGVCEACDSPAPFKREDGEPYLEVHHVRPLAEGGPDSADNAVA
ncbi:HNH endonuclease, partial [Klebsiella pneumoniae]|nr:HNH endonuclease [Klebsiella pneumoniae]